MLGEIAVGHPRVAWPAADDLGESPLWAPDESALYWIDGTAPLLHRLHVPTGQHDARPLNCAAPVGAIVAAQGVGKLLLAHPHGLARFDWQTGRISGVCHPEHGREGVLYNDAKADLDGVLWLGSYDQSEAEPRGALWRLNGGTPSLVESGVAIVNGPALSLDGKTLYLADSLGGRILRYGVHRSAPYLRDRAVFVRFDKLQGLPDGMTIDAEGCLWVAQWGGSRVSRFNVAGHCIQYIDLPVSQITSVAFGGPELETLYITTARYGMNRAALDQQPFAGHLFAVEPGVQGFAETPVEFS